METSFFPLRKWKTDGETLKFSLPVFRTSLSSAPGDDMKLMHFLVGDKERIQLRFSERMDTGIGDEASTAAYIQHVFPTIYRRLVGEWLADALLLSEASVTRNPNDLGSLIVSVELACPEGSVVKMRRLEQEVHLLNMELTASERQKQLFRDAYSALDNKPLLIVAVERFKRFFGGKRRS